MLSENGEIKASDHTRNGIDEEGISSYSRRLYERYSKYLRHCVICGNPFVDRHHIVPKEMFGQDIEENIDYLCSNHHRIVHFLLDVEMQKDKMDKRPKEQQNRYLALYWWILRNERDAVDYFENKMKPMILKRLYEVKRESEKRMER